MSYEFIEFRKHGRIGYVTLNRPDVMNALNSACHTELGRVFDALATDDEVWVVILTGAGTRAFSAGNDLKEAAVSAGKAGEPPPSPVAAGVGGWGGITERWDFVKPVIAAVNGWAMGGGCELALASDIVVAADHARFGLPEPHVGLMAGAGGVHRLPRQIPLKRAMGMILTGKPIDAQTAYEWGLVNEVVPIADLMAAAERWAHEIMRGAPLAIRASKEASMRGLDMPLESAVATRFPVYQLLARSEDRREGPLAFAEKRTPEWKGR